MNSHRWRRMMGVVLAACLVFSAGSVAGQGGESAGMITEIKIGKGRVDVKAAGGGDWKPAAPFLAVRSGDAVRASENATAVIFLTGGRGTVKVEAANSPYSVTGAAAGGKAEKAKSLVAGSIGFLAQGPKEPPKASLSVRAMPGAKAAEVLAPRGGAVLPGPLTIEWLGSQFARYTVKVSSPSGVLLERKVSGARFEYPADAPKLRPGTRYTIVVAADGKRPHEAHFEVLDASKADAVKRRLGELEASLGPNAPPNTLTALRAGLLADEGLLHDARLIVVSAIAKDPDEPALHALLGHIYAKTGLPDQANQELDEAQFLLGK